MIGIEESNTLESKSPITIIIFINKVHHKYTHPQCGHQGDIQVMNIIIQSNNF